MKIDTDAYFARIKQEIDRLENVSLFNEHQLAAWKPISKGRVSGMYLAISLLGDYEIKEDA